MCLDDWVKMVRCGRFIYVPVSEVGLYELSDWHIAEDDINPKMGKSESVKNGIDG